MYHNFLSYLSIYSIISPLQDFLLSYLKIICNLKQVKVELTNVDESMGLDALLSLANGLPTQESSLEDQDPLAISCNEWEGSSSRATGFVGGNETAESSTAFHFDETSCGEPSLELTVVEEPDTIIEI